MMPTLNRRRRTARLALGSLALVSVTTLALAQPIAAAPRLQATDTSTPTNTATATPLPTSTPATPVYTRPLIVLESYGAGSYALTRGQEFDLGLRLRNAGPLKARNIVATFSSTDFLMRVTGGVVAAGGIDGGASTGEPPPMTAHPGL